MPQQIIAVTVLGDDRPGIVADVTAALAGLGCNLEDSTMTLLRGHFAMVVLVRSADRVQAALLPLTAGGDLAVERAADPRARDAVGPAYTLHVHGADRPGIVAAMTRRRAARRQHRRPRDQAAAASTCSSPSAAPRHRRRRGGAATEAREIGVDFHVSVVEDDQL